MKIVVDDPIELRESGIYIIKNLISSKIYVGSTLQSFRIRFRQHKNALLKNKHHNIHLQKSFNKHGKENFVFEIIKINYDPKSIRILEKHYIEWYNSVFNGYNHSSVTDSVPLNKEICLRIGSTLKEKHVNDVEFREEFMKSMQGRKGVPSWNKGLTCKNISDARKKMFDDIEVYDSNMKFFRKFDNAIEIEKFSRQLNNDLPIPEYVEIFNTNANKFSKKPITTKVILSCNIHKAIRLAKPHKGLFFKKVKRTN